MLTITLPRIGTVAAWRGAARTLAGAGMAAEDVTWTIGKKAADLFAGTDIVPSGPQVRLTLPRDVIGSLETVLCHSDPERFARAYDILLRLARRDLRWGDRSDPALHRLLQQGKAVRRDIHKMHSFVRFREIGPPESSRRAFAAWFEPEHLIVEAAAPFFAKRFGDMDWIIATPSLTARFESGSLSFDLTQGKIRPPADDSEALWRTYFANIFNPARLMVSAMTSEMPKKYWKNLPEADLIPEMIRTAPARAREMHLKAPTLPPAHLDRLVTPRRTISETLTLETLKPVLDACRRCPLGACATQGVAGEGPFDARLMIVGEQPGDHEDLSGRPFVGPAGQVLNHALAKAGIARNSVYLTNAVKHFKFQPRGKRRLHQRPNAGEIAHCKWWLDFERAAVKPKLVVALGATALHALTGHGSNLNARRGTREELADGTEVLISYHPSYILRLPPGPAADAARDALTTDLTLAAEIVRSQASGSMPNAALSQPFKRA